MTREITITFEMDSGLDDTATKHVCQHAVQSMADGEIDVEITNTEEY